MSIPHGLPSGSAVSACKSFYMVFFHIASPSSNPRPNAVTIRDAREVLAKTVVAGHSSVSAALVICLDSFEAFYR